ncbi:MAG: RDD family protein [Pseudomonadota bacterium]
MQSNAIAPPAPLLVRLATLVYESLLVVAVVFVASFVALPVVGELHAPWQRHLFQGFLLFVLFAYFAAFWLTSGQTLAMKTWRVRLVRADGRRLRLVDTLLRFVLACIGLALAGLGFWWALVDRDRQFLHDRLLGTRLIRVPRKA